MATQLKSKPGLSSTTALSIPKDWDPTWFRHFISNQLKGADVRNAIGANGITISGSIASPYATIGFNGTGVITSVVGTANEIAVSTTGGVATISFSPNVVIPAPPSGTTLTLNSDSTALVIQMVTSAGDAYQRFNNQAGTRRLEFVAIGSTGSAAYGASAGDQVINANSGNLFISTGDLARIGISNAGATTFLAASGQNTVTINSASGVNALVLSAGGSNGAGGIVQEAIAVPTLVMNSSGADFGQIGDAGSQKWFLGFGTTTTANGTAALTWNATGNVVIGAASSGYSLEVDGSTSGSGSGIKVHTSGGIDLLSYIDSGGSGWTNTNPYTSGAMVYLNGSTVDFYSLGTLVGNISTGGFNVAVGTSISTGTNLPLLLTTSSSGPWALEVTRSDVASTIHVFNGATSGANGYWYFSEQVACNGKNVLYSNDASLNTVGGKVSSQSGGTASGGNAGDIILIY